MDKETRQGLGAFLFITMLVIGIAVYAYYFVYGRTAMALDVFQAKEYLWRARASDNLEEIASYMNKSLQALKNRSGNPNWLFHLPDTDIDLIKHDLEKNIEIALNISKSESMSSYGYQRAVDNLQEICIELNEHLDIAISWFTDKHPMTIILNVIGWAIFIAGIIMMEVD